MLENKLTILVFLKDRATFTKRLYDYLSLIQYPCKVFFADGSIENENEEFFHSIQQKKFNYIYKRYNKDLLLSDYYKKCAASILEVRTKYTMLVDNDDFPILSGQLKAIEFLDNNPNYVGCNGRIAGVKLSKNSVIPYGDYVLYLPYYCSIMDVQMNVDQDDPIDRINSYLKNFYSIFYSIFTTESLVNTFSKIKEFCFSDLGITELFFSYMQLIQGKIKSINNVAYLRQHGSSQAAASQKDWFFRLFYTDWLYDLKKAVGYIAECISLNTNVSYQPMYDKLYLAFVNRHRERYIVNDFYFLKNLNILLKKHRLQAIFFNKIFNKVPALCEKLSKNFLKENVDFTELQNIKKIISAKIYD